ncbi:MAG: ABC transporter ATP-binding protein [Verrucomicrobiales bacterium]|nr:ABC transporter ATP-binding protein [Verrucomicrobiales bacterium]
MSLDTKKASAKGSLRGLLLVLRYLKSYPIGVSLAVGLLLVNIGIEMTLPQIVGAAMTGMQRHETSGAPFVPGPFVAAFLSLVTLRAVIGIIVGPIRNRAVQQSLNDLRADIYDALQRLAFGFHDRSSSGELISRSTTDVWRLQDFFFACLFLLVDIGAALVVTVVLIFLTHVWLGWATVLTIVPTVGLIAFFAAKLQPQWRQVHDLHGAMTSVIQENIAGVRVVKAFAREQSEIDKFRGRKDVFLSTVMRTVNYWASRVPLAQFIFGLSVPLVLWIGGREVIRGDLPVGDLGKVILYLMAISHRMGMVGQFTSILQNASASADRIMEIIREPRTVVSGVRTLPEGGGRVEFRKVSFQHRREGGLMGDRTDAAPDHPGESPTPAAAEPGTAALREVCFRIEPGQTVAIVGPTGSGKSTLVSLIPRFHDLVDGEILLDGVDVRELSLHELRRSVGFIFQDTFLFSATVAENIAYGRPSANRDEIEAAAAAARAHEFIQKLDQGYDTVIGERGVSLSGGQRQRIAIARAFLMNPRWLVMDDATASVDAETERLIQEAMRQLCAGRTTLVIAQRLSTVRHADVILVLRDGRVVESGTHEALLREGSFYRQVFEQQIHA